jgi:hypothetical protein
MAWDELPQGYVWFFFFAMATMQALNFSWFSKMVASVRSRRKPVHTFDGEVPKTLKME